ncbi:hypothetical protein CDAR_378311 [Caerostris darwini]|uniref:Uncharacterized protein n=1 Tax=Caerostris darwini TaxID=1538125 RepID=A0AAV4T5W2_9ARAC|nr:hypothetical protein CDAR_378311 [Caerostris darwini]
MRSTIFSPCQQAVQQNISLSMKFFIMKHPSPLKLRERHKRENEAKERPSSQHPSYRRGINQRLKHPLLTGRNKGCHLSVGAFISEQMQSMEATL